MLVYDMKALFKLRFNVRPAKKIIMNITGRLKKVVDLWLIIIFKYQLNRIFI